MTLGLTARQAKARDFIARHLAETGYAPSFREIGSALGIRSKSGVHRVVSGLEARGVIERKKYYARSITLAEEAKDVAAEHLLHAICERKIGMLQALEQIFGKAPEYTTLAAAIEQVAWAWERLQEGRGQ